MATTVVGGLTLSFTDEGAGSVVVLLHGWGGRAASMTPLANALRERFRVLAFDLPGFGETSLPPEPWGTFEYASFVAAALAGLGVQRASFIGHSFGGRLGIWLAANRPELVQSLVLIDSAGVKPLPTLKRRLRTAVFKAAKALLRLRILGRAGPALQERLAAKLGSADYRAATGVMRASMVKTVNEDVTHLLPRIGVPTLLLWGENDKETPVADGEKMAGLIGDAVLIRVAGAGHFSYLENPLYVQAVVIAFLDGVLAEARR